MSLEMLVPDMRNIERIKNSALSIFSNQIFDECSLFQFWSRVLCELEMTFAVFASGSANTFHLPLSASCITNTAVENKVAISFKCTETSTDFWLFLTVFSFKQTLVKTWQKCPGHNLVLLFSQGLGLVIKSVMSLSLGVGHEFVPVVGHRISHGVGHGVCLSVWTLSWGWPLPDIILFKCLKH